MDNNIALVRKLLTETKERIAYLKKLYADVPDSIFDAILKTDPTAKVVNNVVVKAGQYSQWTLQQYKTASAGSKSRFLEDLYKINDALQIYEKIKNKLDVNARNIFNFKNLESLYSVIKPYEQQVKDAEQKEKNKQGLELLYEDEKCVLYHILTKEASIANYHHPITNWCTADTRERFNKFDSHNESGPLYVIEDKTTDELYQLHFATKQYMNADDKPVDLKRLLDVYPNTKQILYTREKSTIDLSLAGDLLTLFEIEIGRAHV